MLERWVDLLPERTRPRHIRYLGLPGSLEGGTATFLAFCDFDRRPSFVAKVHRDPAGEPRARAERDMLTRLCSIPGITGSVPRPLLLERLGGVPTLAQTVLEGAPMRARMAEDGRPELRSAEEHFRAASDWLLLLREETADPDAGPDVESRAAADIEECVRVFGFPPETAGELRRRIAATSRAGPPGAAHGDFCRHNLLLSGSGLSVIDWTDARPKTAPLHDLFFFLATYFLQARKAGGVGSFLQAFDETFLEDNPYSRLVSRCVEDHARRAGIERDAVPGLFFQFLLERSLFEHRQAAKAALSGNWSRFGLYLAGQAGASAAGYPRAQLWRLFLARALEKKEAPRMRGVLPASGPCSCRDYAGHTVSVIVPCREEAANIGRCLDSFVHCTHPKDRLEVLIVDAMSSDGTRAIVEDYARRHPFIRLVDNPERTIPRALNIGISRARGDMVARLDAHSALPPQYLSECLRALHLHRADRVGGRIATRPQQETTAGRAIALALSVPFGVGNSRFRTSAGGDPRPVWVDTVPFWCCPKSLLLELGPFNERLPNSEDIEYSMRLKARGARTLLLPSLEGTYYARSRLGAFWRHNVYNGRWAVLPFLHSRHIPVAPRHLVPLAFVACLGLLSLLSLLSEFFLVPLVLAVASYVSCNAAVSIALARRERDIALLAHLPLAFAALHIGYGVGSAAGSVRLLLGKLRGEGPDGGD